MEPERCTRAIGVLAAFLGVAAIVLDDPAFFLAAFSLVLSAAFLAVRFRLRMHRIVSSAAVERTANRKIFPQGGTAVILTTFSCSPEQGTSVSIREILPPAAGAGTSAHIMPVGPDGTATLLYNLTPLVQGTIAVEGIVLTVTDPFFTADLLMTSRPFSGPELEVYPHAAYERFRTRGATAREKNRPNIERGSNIRTVREYLPGDDIRSVDWKITAKHQRMYIREYTSIENTPPLIVLDVPGDESPVADEALATLINGANQATASAIRHYGTVSLLIVSGINVISILLEERNPQRCTGALLDAAGPQVRLHHAYRWKNRTTLRSHVRISGRMVTRTEGPVRRFHARLATVYKRSLAGPDVPVFVTQAESLLRTLPLKEIVLFSLFTGDTSHLRELVFQAQEKDIRVIPRTVAAPDETAGGAPPDLPGADPVEVIA